MHWSCSVATAQNAVVGYQQICVFLCTGTVQHDGRGQNRRFGTTFFNLQLLKEYGSK